MRLLALCASLAIVTFAPSAPAQEAPAQEAPAQEACIKSYEGAQELRAAGSLIAARVELARCIAECSGTPRSQCSEWLDEVERSIPTVVLELVDDKGASRSDARVTIDGKPLADRLDGRAVAVDPGPHTFVFEARGMHPVRRSFTVLEGDKRRKLSVSLAPAKRPPVREERGWVAPHPATWALAGLSLVGFGFFAGFGIHSLTLEDCKDNPPTGCTDDEVDTIKTERTVADVGLGVGAAALASALIVGLVTASAGAGDTAMIVTPTGAVWITRW